MEPNHLTVRQTNWNKPGLFGRLVLWNRPRGIRSQKTQVNWWFAVCLNQRNISNHIFSIASYCVESHCVESNRNRIALHRDRGESYRIASLAASYVSSVYRIVGFASRCVSRADPPYTQNNTRISLKDVFILVSFLIWPVLMKTGMITYFNAVRFHAKSAKACNVKVVQSLALTKKNELNAYRVCFPSRVKHGQMGFIHSFQAESCLLM